ncbi:MAG: hypothetical protein WC438_05170 [Candidatus Pacearchaeota archaeon]
MKAKIQKSIIQKPIYAQCYKCYIKYNMVKFGVNCPICSKKKVVVIASN